MRNILLLFSLLSYTWCQFLREVNHNFNAVEQPKLLFLDQHDHDAPKQEKFIDKFEEYAQLSSHRHHGAGVLLMGGFLRGLKIFNNVTHQKECAQLWAVLHDDYADICDRIRNITDKGEIVDALKYIINKIEDMQSHWNTSHGDCQQMCNDMRDIMKQVKAHLNQEQQIKHITVHFFQNIGAFIQRYENFMDNLRTHNFYKAGICLGDLANYLLLWDFAPQELTKMVEQMEKKENHKWSHLINFE